MIKRRLTHANKHQIIDLIDQLDYSHAYEIQIKRYSPKRTNPQNNLLWKWNTEVAAELSAFTGHHWTAEQVHYRIFCPKFLQGRVVTLPDNSQAWVSETSSNQSVVDLSEALQKYEVWCLTNDINITQPCEGL
jgi:hypothetical protein